MRALVKRFPEPGIWMEDVPMPEVGVNDVPEGMYIVNVKSKKGQTSQKIMRVP